MGSGEMRELCDRRTDDTENLHPDSMVSMCVVCTDLVMTMLVYAYLQSFW